jgi:hypothetical protein
MCVRKDLVSPALSGKIWNDPLGRGVVCHHPAWAHLHTFWGILVSSMGISTYLLDMLASRLGTFAYRLGILASRLVCRGLVRGLCAHRHSPWGHRYPLGLIRIPFGSTGNPLGHICGPLGIHSIPLVLARG